MVKPQRILILGSSGLVGKSIARQQYPFINPNDTMWYFATSKDADLRSFIDIEKLFQKILPTHVIHLAANVKGIYKDITENATLLIDNLRININVLEMCNKFNVQRAVVCLSPCIYPSASRYMTEDIIHDGPPSDKIFGYAYAKRMSDILCKAFNEQYNREYISIIPCNVYGPEDNFDLNDSQVIPNIIHKAYISHTTNTILKIDKAYNHFKQFVYVDDMAWLCVWALFKYDKPNERITFAPDETDVTLEKIVNLVTNQFKINYELQDTLIDYKVVSNDKLRSSLKRTGFEDFQFTTVEIGIEKTIKWFIENYNNIRGK